MRNTENICKVPCTQNILSMVMSVTVYYHYWFLTIKCTLSLEIINLGLENAKCNLELFLQFVQFFWPKQLRLSSFLYKQTQFSLLFTHFLPKPKQHQFTKSICKFGRFKKYKSTAEWFGFQQCVGEGNGPLSLESWRCYFHFTWATNQPVIASFVPLLNADVL